MTNTLILYSQETKDLLHLFPKHINSLIITQDNKTLLSTLDSNYERIIILGLKEAKQIAIEASIVKVINNYHFTCLTKTALDQDTMNLHQSLGISEFMSI